ncbi:MAG: phosphatase PAP2 family protein [Actinomycetota bacterium]
MTRPSAILQRPLPGRTVATRLLWVGAAAAVLFLALTVFVMVNIDNPTGADLRVTESFFTAGIDHPQLLSLAEFLAWFGGARNIAFIAVAVLVLAYIRAWPWAMFFLALSAGSIALGNLVKFSVGRERPPWVTHEALQQTLSFPSGHTLTGITVWCAAALIGWYLLPPTIAPWLCSTFLVIGLLQGPARMILGKHWGTDVLGALLLGSACLLIAWSIFLIWWHRKLTTASTSDTDDGFSHAMHPH